MQTAEKIPNYGKTKLACYMGMITQAITSNFAPLMFLKFHNDYSIPLGSIALISVIFFVVQMLIDFFCARFVDRIGYRKTIVASQFFAGFGLVCLAFLPDLLPDPFIGILVSVVIYGLGSGLAEVLCSPIIEACPFKHKEAAMSLLHSFFCWGQLLTVIVSTLFFYFFGIESWKWMACIWALVPFVNMYNYATCPINLLVENGKQMGTKKLFKTPMFWVFGLLILCAGSSEVAMSQWASAFAESALGLTKTMGDLLGPGLFAVTMAVSRVFYGKLGHKINLYRFMLGSGILCLVCYVMASLFDSSIVGLIGCIACGFTVGIMWPGTLSISSKAFPAGGTALFAMLALFGDFGCAAGPGIVGKVAEISGDNIRTGLAVGSIFPLTLIVIVVILMIKNKRNKDNEVTL